MVIEVFPFFYGKKYFLYQIIIYVNSIFIKNDVKHLSYVFHWPKKKIYIYIYIFWKKVPNDFVNFLYDNEYETNDS